jgi:hypothetical protein
MQTLTDRKKFVAQWTVSIHKKSPYHKQGLFLCKLLAVKLVH